MKKENDRQELQRRLEQARRIVIKMIDVQTIEDLNKMIADIEDDIRKADSPGAETLKRIGTNSLRHCWDLRHPALRARDDGGGLVGACRMRSAAPPAWASR